MGLSQGRSQASRIWGGSSRPGFGSKPHEPLPHGLLPSLYQGRVAQLAREAVESPAPETLEATLKRCIAFCYGVTAEWAPHVRVTVFADNPSEHQMNVPVYDTLLLAWGAPGSEGVEVRCTPIEGTDVMYGRIVPNPFWSRTVRARSGREVSCRDLIHQLLHWFVCLDDRDARKQLLVNMILQLHEACFNCIGRHKEVFEYCVYDLVEAEAQQAPGGGAATPADANPESARPPAADAESALAAPARPAVPEAARRAVRRFAAQFLDRHKRAALHAAVLSPLKFIYQYQYEVFENLDSHGASFWVAVLTDVFYPGLEMPFESIVDLDGGWSWGAVDFLPAMLREGSSDFEALRRISAPENLGRDWRRLTAKLRPTGPLPRRLPGLPSPGVRRFRQALIEARRPESALHEALKPYAVRFAELMARPILLRRCVLQASASERWDLELGPALAELSREALGRDAGAPELRERLCFGAAGRGSQEDARASADEEAMSALLRAAGVAWA